MLVLVLISRPALKEECGEGPHFPLFPFLHLRMGTGEHFGRTDQSMFAVLLNLSVIITVHPR